MHEIFPPVETYRVERYLLDGNTTEENSGNANGLMFDHDGVLIACRHGAREVSSWSNKRPDRFRPAATQQYEGKKLNSPNDLVMSNRGLIYFTDPRYGSTKGKELDF